MLTKLQHNSTSRHEISMAISISIVGMFLSFLWGCQAFNVSAPSATTTTDTTTTSTTTTTVDVGGGCGGSCTTPVGALALDTCFNESGATAGRIHFKTDLTEAALAYNKH